MELIGALLVLTGLLVAVGGGLAIIIPLRVLRLSTRGRGVFAALVGLMVMGVGGSFLPPVERRQLSRSGSSHAASGTPTSSSNENSRSPTLRELTVCEALGQPAGKRIRVRGEFDGFTYATKSRTFLIPSRGVCTSDGAGSVWVELQDASEREKVTRHKPRNNRKREPGDLVTVEGDVAPGRNARSVRLRRAIVIR